MPCPPQKILPPSVYFFLYYYPYVICILIQMVAREMRSKIWRGRGKYGGGGPDVVFMATTTINDTADTMVTIDLPP